jgi:hypothetical protein
MEAFWLAANAHNWQQPEARQEFRLYYDDTGNVLHYSMEDLPGNFLVIDRLTFDQQRFDIKIKDGKIAKLNHPASWKLAPADHGTPCYPTDVSIVVSDNAENKQYWEVKTTYESD